MRIGEVAEQTGLSISNIRFYEKKGLIRPEREQQSKYRDYSDEDVRQLKLILLYRKMNLSIETIGDLTEEKVPVGEVLEQQLSNLREEQRKLQGSIDLCSKFMEDRIAIHAGEGRAEQADSAVAAQGITRLSEAEIDAYLNYVKEEEKLGHSFADVEELLEDFAEFTQFGRVVDSNGLGLWLVQHPLLRRGLTALWSAMFLLLPLGVIADRILDGEEISIPWLMFWAMWLLFFAVSFGQFWGARKKKR